jgi:hypothetical protein
MQFSSRLAKKNGHQLLIVQFALLFLFFFRPGIALRMNGVFDEPCYLAWTKWFMGEFSATCEGKQHFGGIALLWLPFALIGKGFAALTKTPLEESIVFFIGISSFLYLCLSGYFLSLSLKKFLEDQQTRFSKKMDPLPFLLICSSPVVYYATVRTLLPHAGELFLSSLLVFFGLRGKSYGAAVVAFLLCLTRPQNLGCWAYVATLSELRPTQKKMFRGLGIILFILLSYWWCYFGYHQTYFLPTVLRVSFRDLALFLLQIDFGILWTQTTWFFAFLYVLFLKKPTQNQIGLWVWLLISGLTCIIWPTNGSSYGFRYLIGSYAAVWLLLLELLSRDKLRKFFGVFLSLTAIWNLALVWVFPAPAPLWPFVRPQEKIIGIPSLVWSSLTQNVQAVVSMFKFSALAQACRQLGFCEEMQMSMSGQTVNYRLEGNLEKLNLLITVAVVAVMIWSILRLLKNKLT